MSHYPSKHFTCIVHLIAFLYITYLRSSLATAHFIVPYPTVPYHVHDPSNRDVSVSLFCTSRRWQTDVNNPCRRVLTKSNPDFICQVGIVTTQKSFNNTCRNDVNMGRLAEMQRKLLEVRKLAVSVLAKLTTAFLANDGTRGYGYCERKSTLDGWKSVQKLPVRHMSTYTFHKHGACWAQHDLGLDFILTLLNHYVLFRKWI
jgi:hypothetical protein